MAWQYCSGDAKSGRIQRIDWSWEKKMGLGGQEAELDQSVNPQPSSIDWVARAHAVSPAIAAALERIESERRVPSDVMAALHDAELFRMCLPPWLNGGEADPMTVLEVMEIIAAEDASTAWCLGQGLGCSRMAGFLERDVAREVFGSHDAVLAWGPPNGAAKAVAVDDGYRVTGKWRLASGIRNANWLGPICTVFEPDGTPRLGGDGKPVSRSMLLPISDAKLSDVWYVVGLRGTGSDSFEIDDLYVAEKYSFGRDSQAERKEDGYLYRMGLSFFYSVAFAGVALGVARRTLDEFVVMAAEKKPSHANEVLRESSAVQREFGEIEALLDSARTYLYDRISTAWHSGFPPDVWPAELRARLRLATTNAIYRSRDAVEFAYRAAGSGAIFVENPFERRFRDINTVAQQAQGQPVNFEHAGSVLMGLEVKGGRV